MVLAGNLEKARLLSEYQLTMVKLYRKILQDKKNGTISDHDFIATKVDLVREMYAVRTIRRLMAGKSGETINW